MRRILVVLVVIYALAFSGTVTLGSDATVKCSVAYGGKITAAEGTRVAERVGAWLGQAKDVAVKSWTPGDFAQTIENVWHKVLWLWVKSFLSGGHGKKVDPEIITLREQADQQQADAEAQCTPCPVSDQDQNPDGGDNGTPPDGDGNDPRVSIPAVAARLSGASLAADALRRAGFPADQIVMGVAVAKLESGFDPAAINSLGVRGMFQVYYRVHPELTMTGWQDPYKNARDAYSIYRAAGNSWSPWSTAAAARRQLDQVAPKIGGQGSARVQLPDDGTRRQGQGCTPVVGDQDDQQGTGSFVSADFSIYSNPRTVAQAIGYMDRMVRNQTPIPSGRCLHYVGAAYGYQGTHTEDGSHFAIEHWSITPAKYKHPGADGSKAPRGSLLYWNTGPGRAGHIAIAAGNGMVYSTDAPTRGMIGLVPFSYFKGYGEFVGYADPYFPGQTKVKSSSYTVAA